MTAYPSLYREFDVTDDAAWFAASAGWSADAAAYLAWLLTSRHTDGGGASPAPAVTAPQTECHSAIIPPIAPNGPPTGAPVSREVAA